MKIILTAYYYKTKQSKAKFKAFCVFRFLRYRNICSDVLSMCILPGLG